MVKAYHGIQLTSILGQLLLNILLKVSVKRKIVYIRFVPVAHVYVQLFSISIIYFFELKNKIWWFYFKHFFLFIFFFLFFLQAFFIKNSKQVINKLKMVLL